MAQPASHSSHRQDPDPGPIIVGIDVGLTYTGISFCSLNKPKIEVIKAWPGTPIEDKYDKAPTVLKYRGGIRRAKSWGFQCANSEDPDDGLTTIGRFKLQLDKNYSNSQPDRRCPGTQEDVHQWFEDYLREVYNHIVETLPEKFGLNETSWTQTTVYFCFSVPTMWEGGGVVKEFERIAKTAGFGCDRKHHIVEDHIIEFDLNEAEAAAIYTAKNARDQFRVLENGRVNPDDNIPPVVDALDNIPNLRRGQVFLVADLGGGTTDFETFKVVEVVKAEVNWYSRDRHTEQIAKLRRLAFIGDRYNNAVGSTNIDDAFEKLVEERLGKIPSHILTPKSMEAVAKAIVRDESFIGKILTTLEHWIPVRSPLSIANETTKNQDVRDGVLARIPTNSPVSKTAKEIAREITRGKFQDIKHDFGTATSAPYQRFRFLVSAHSNVKVEEAGFDGGVLVFQPEEIAKLFDTQLTRIFLLVDAQLNRSENERVTCIVLSGGFASSHYVQRQILEHYGPGGHGIEILISDQPQLAVCKGLAIDKMHKLKFGLEILGTRTCSDSYGIVYREAISHRRDNNPKWSSRIPLSPFRKARATVKHSICWLIKRGRTYSRDNAISCQFRCNVPKSKDDIIGIDNKTITFNHAIVKFRALSDSLPSIPSAEGVHEVGQITYTLPLRQILMRADQRCDFVKRKRRKVFSECWDIKLELQMFIESFGVSFKIWCGLDLIGTAGPFHVNWRSPTPPPPPPPPHPPPPTSLLQHPAAIFHNISASAGMENPAFIQIPDNELPMQLLSRTSIDDGRESDEVVRIG